MSPPNNVTQLVTTIDEKNQADHERIFDQLEVVESDLKEINKEISSFKVEQTRISMSVVKIEEILSDLKEEKKTTGKWVRSIVGKIAILILTAALGGGITLNATELLASKDTPTEQVSGE